MRNDTINRNAAINAIKRAIWNKQTAKDAIDAVCNIPSEQPEQRWTPVSESLPEAGKQILVCDDFGSVYIAEYEEISDGEWRWVETVEYRSLYGIVAWMPLPDPWKGEEDEV